MTKREICERLVSYYVIMGLKLPDASDLRTLLDLSAPVEEASKAEEKHPGVIAKPGKDGEIVWCWCQKCYEQAAVVHDPFGDGENWSYCKKCGVSFRLKRGEENEAKRKEDL